jgi:glycolate oxidase FAD binding subunit
MSQAGAATIERAWNELAAIVGHEHLRPAGGDDAVDGIQPRGVIAPENAQQLAQVLRYCSSAGLAVIPRGSGTKLWLGNRPEKADFVLSTARFNRVIEHAWDDMTTTVEAGCPIASLQNVLRQHGQMLAADTLRPERATVGGVLATADTGSLRIRYGGIRDLVLGLQMALPDGSLVNAGGKVVKNVAGYDLTKLCIGSLGTLGVITRAVFRLHPVPFAVASYSALLASASDAAQLALAILDSHLVYTGLQLRAQRADRITIDVRFEGIPELLQDQFGKLGRVAGGHTFSESEGDAWSARPKLFAGASDAVICKCTVLPAQIGALCDAVYRQADRAGAQVGVVVQATGVADVRLDGVSLPACAAMVKALRGELEHLDGTLAVQRCPAALKQALDIWGSVKDALPLMRQIKQKFDPARILNPGRFVGGI